MLNFPLVNKPCQSHQYIWICYFDLLPTLDYAGININTQDCGMTHVASKSTLAPFPEVTSSS